MADENLFTFSVDLDAKIKADKQSLSSASSTFDAFYNKYNDKKIEVEFDKKAFKQSVNSLSQQTHKAVMDAKQYMTQYNSLMSNQQSWIHVDDEQNNYEQRMLMMREMFKDIKIGFNDGSVLNGFDEIFKDMGDGITQFENKISAGISFVDLGEQIDYLREKEQQLVNTLKESGARDWRGKFDMSAGDMDSSALYDRIEALKELSAVQNGIEMFSSKKLSYKDFASNESTSYIDSYINNLETEYQELKKFNIATINELKKRKDLLDRTQSVEFGDYSLQEAKNNISDKKAYDENISDLQGYIEQKKSLIEEMRENSNLFLYDNDGDYSDGDFLDRQIQEIRSQISGYEQYINELQSTRQNFLNGESNQGKTFNVDLTEVIEQLDSIKKSINGVLDAFRPLTDAMANGESALSTMLSASSLQVDDLIAKFNLLGETVQNIEKKNFNITNVSQTVTNGTNAAQNKIAELQDQAKSMYQIVLQLQTELAKTAIGLPQGTEEKSITARASFNLMDEKDASVLGASMLELEKGINNKSVKGLNAIIEKLNVAIQRLNEMNQLRNKVEAGSWTDIVYNQQDDEKLNSTTNTNNINNTSSGKVDSITQNVESESSSVSKLGTEVLSVTEAINNKTQAFMQEETIVAGVISNEITMLNELKLAINEITNGLNSTDFSATMFNDEQIQATSDRILRYFIDLQQKINNLEFHINATIPEVEESEHKNGTDTNPTSKETTPQTSAGIGTAKIVESIASGAEHAAESTDKLEHANKSLGESVKSTSQLIREEIDELDAVNKQAESAEATAERAARNKSQLDKESYLYEGDSKEPSKMTYTSSSKGKSAYKTVTETYTMNDEGLPELDTVQVVNDLKKLRDETTKNDKAISTADKKLQKYISDFESKTLGNAKYIKGFDDLKGFKIANVEDIDDAIQKMALLDAEYSKIVLNFRKGSSSLNPFTNGIKTASEAATKFKAIDLNFKNLDFNASDSLTVKMERLEELKNNLMDATEKIKNGEEFSIDDFTKFSEEVGEFKQLSNEVSASIKNEQTEYRNLISLQDELYKNKKAQAKADYGSQEYEDYTAKIIEQEEKLSKALEGSQFKDAIKARADGLEKEVKAIEDSKISSEWDEYEKLNSDIVQQDSLLTKQQSALEKSGALTDEFRRKINELRNDLANVTDADSLEAWKDKWKLLQNEIATVKNEIDSTRKEDALQLNIDGAFGNLDKQMLTWQKSGQLTDELQEKVYELVDALSKVSTQGDLTNWNKSFMNLKREVAATKIEVDAVRQSEEKEAAVENERVMSQYTQYYDTIKKRNDALQKAMSAKGVNEKQYWTNQYQHYNDESIIYQNTGMGDFFASAGNQAIIGAENIAKFNAELERSNLLLSQQKDAQIADQANDEKTKLQELDKLYKQIAESVAKITEYKSKLKSGNLGEEEAARTKEKYDEESENFKKLQAEAEGYGPLYNSSKRQLAVDEARNEVLSKNADIQAKETDKNTSAQKQEELNKLYQKRQNIINNIISSQEKLNKATTLSGKTEAAKQLEEDKKNYDSINKQIDAYGDLADAKKLANQDQQFVEKTKSNNKNNAAVSAEYFGQQQFKDIKDTYSKYLEAQANIQKMQADMSGKDYTAQLANETNNAYQAQQKLLGLGIDIEDVQSSGVLTEQQKVELLKQEADYQEKIAKNTAAALDNASNAEQKENAKQTKKQEQAQEKIDNQNKNYGKTAYNKETKNYENIDATIRSLEVDNITPILDQRVEAYKSAYEKLQSLRNIFANNPQAINDDSLKMQFQDAALEAENARKEVQELLKQTVKLQSIPESAILGNPKNISNLSNLKAEMEQYARQVSNGSLSITGFNSTGTEMYGVIDKGRGILEKMTVTLDQSTNQLYAYRTATENTGTVWQNLTTGMSSKLKELFNYAVAGGGMYAVFNQFRQGLTYVREIDSALTELKKVTDETDASYDRFLQTMSQSAGNIGSTVKDLTSSAADWSRLGYSMQEAGELAENTSILMNVSEFDDVSSATDAMISTLQAFKNESMDVGDYSMQIIDEFNEVGNNYAISTSDLANSLTNSSAALVEANNSLEQSIAMTTAANTIIQDPDAVGNALKVVSMRIRGVKTELEDAGEDTDGMITNTAKLQEKVKALTNVDGSGGINVLTDSGEFKSTYDILLSISKIWSQISDVNQAALLEILAGKTRGSSVAAILQNGDVMEESYNSAVNASGSAANELDTYLNSIEGRIQLLTNSIQTMWMNTLNSDALKFIIDLANGLVQIADKLGLINTLVVALAAKSAFSKKSSFGAFFDYDNNTGDITSGRWGRALSNIGKSRQTEDNIVVPVKPQVDTVASDQASKSVEESIPDQIPVEVVPTTKGQDVAHNDLNQFDTKNNEQIQTPVDLEVEPTNIDTSDITKNVNDAVEEAVDKTSEFNIDLSKIDAQIADKQSELAAEQAKLDIAISNADNTKGKGKRARDTAKKEVKRQQKVVEDTENQLQGLNTHRDNIVKKQLEKQNQLPEEVTVDVEPQVQGDAVQDIQTQIEGAGDVTIPVKPEVVANDVNVPNGTNQDANTPIQIECTDIDTKPVEEMTEQLDNMAEVAENASCSMDTFTEANNNMNTSAQQTGANVGAGVEAMEATGAAAEEAGAGVDALGASQQSQGTAADGASVKNTVNAGSEKAVGEAGTVASFGVQLLNAALSMGIALLAGFAFSALIKGVDALVNKTENLREKVADLNDEYSKQKDQFNENIKELTTPIDSSSYETLEEEFTRLCSGVNSLGENVSLTAEQYERYEQICETICGVNPNLAEGYDDVTTAIGNNASALSNLIELQKLQARQNAYEYVDDENLTDIANNAINQYDDAYEAVEDAKNKRLPEDVASNVRSALNQALLNVDEDGTNHGHSEFDLYKALGLEEAWSSGDYAYVNSFDEYVRDHYDVLKGVLEKYQDGLEISGGEGTLSINKDAIVTALTYLNDGAKEYEDGIDIAEEKLKTEKEGLINTLLQVPYSMEEYDSLDTTSKSMITEWIKNNPAFQIDEDTTTDKVLEWKTQIRTMITDFQGVFNDELTELSDGTKTTSNDLLSSLLELDPSKLNWEQYKEDAQYYLDSLKQIFTDKGFIGEGKMFENDVAFDDFFGFNFEEDDKNIDKTVEQLAGFMGKDIKEVQDWLNDKSAFEVKAILNVDWDVVGDDGVNNFEDVDKIIAPDVSAVSATAHTYSSLTDSLTEYKDTLKSVNEIQLDGTKISQDLADALKEYIGDTEEFNKVIDEENGNIVTNIDGLKQLIKGKKKEILNNTKLSRSQAMLKYYNLYQQMEKVRAGSTNLTASQKAQINALYEEMGVLQQTITKYNMLEQQLLGTTNAFDKFSEAQETDSETDYIGTVEDMNVALRQCFETSDLGSETARAAIEGLVPSSVYEDLDTLDEKMAAIDKYLKTDMSKMLTFEYDDDGLVTSAEMTSNNVDYIIQKGLNNGVFEGDDTSHFDLSPDIKSLQEFADQMDITEEMAFAFIKKLDDQDISWLDGDYSSLFDKWFPDSSIEGKIYDTTTSLANLNQQLASGQVTPEEYGEQYVLLTQQLDGAGQSARNNIKNYNDLTSQIESETGKVKTLTNEINTMREQGKSETEIQVKADELTVVSGHLQELLAERGKLEEPTVMTIQFAIDSVNTDIENLKKQWESEGNVIDIDAVVKPNPELDNDFAPVEIPANLEISDESLYIMQQYANLQNEKKEYELTIDAHSEEAQEKIETLTGAIDAAYDALQNISDSNINIDTSAAINKIEDLQRTIDSLTGKTVHNYVYNHTVNDSGSSSTKTTDYWSKYYGNVNGTAHASGNAHSSGNWGLPSSEHNALVGELGKETVVDPRTGMYYTVGDNGAELVDLPKGAIIFNHKQTEDLFSHGYITSRGKIHMNGTAHESGNAHVGVTRYTTSAKSQSTSSSNSNSSSSSNASDAAEDTTEIFNWFEIILEEINAQIDIMNSRLENAVGIKAKNNILDQIMNADLNKLDKLQEGLKLYSNYANELLGKIPAEYRDMAKNGAVAIDEFASDADSETLDAINNYREWAQNVEDLVQQMEDLNSEISDLAKQKFDNIANQYDNVIGLIGNANDKLDAQISLLEDRGYVAATSYYEKMIGNSQAMIKQLQTERTELQKNLDESVQKGTVKVGSDIWYDMVNAIYDVDDAIVEATSDIEEFQNNINDIYWDNFDELINRLDYFKNEVESLIDIMSKDDLVDKQGEWTEKGIASLGLYAQKMELAENQVKKYQSAIDDLNKDYKAGKYSETEYLEKLDELKSAQYDSITSYYDARDAIVDLNSTRVDSIKDGIQKEIDAYDELIKKKKDELSAEQDLHDFRNNVKDQSKVIADIEKQLAAMSGDNSAATLAKRKQLEAELADAKSELEETYYDHSITAQQDAYDKELEDFQDTKDDEMEKWDEYLENIDQVLTDSFKTVQDNTEGIYTTLLQMGSDYGIQLSDSVVSPWRDGISAIGEYQDKFTESTSTTKQQLEEMQNDWQAVIDKINEEAAAEQQRQQQENNSHTQATYQAPITSTTSNSSQQAQQAQAATPSTPSVGSSVKIKSTASKYGGQSSNTSIPSWVKNGTYTVQQIGYNGEQALLKEILSWVKISDLEGYAKGTTGVDEDKFAWIDELGEELVMHADGSGRLSYMTKGTSVVPSQLTENIMALGQLDPRDILNASRASLVKTPSVTQQTISLDMNIGEVVHIEHADSDSAEDIAKVVTKQMDSYVQKMNNSLKRYTR